MKDTPEPECFSYPPLQMRIFLKTVAARGRREVLFIPTFILGLLELCSSRAFLWWWAWCCACHLPKPYFPKLPATRWQLSSPSLSWLFFKSTPTNRIPAGNGSLVRKCQIWFLNKFAPCNEVASPAQRDHKNWMQARVPHPRWPWCSAPTTPTVWSW